MSEPIEAFELRLLAIFAQEARAHLAHLGASLAALGPAGARERAALLASILEALHTLAGAARSVDLGELEWLCRALEAVFAAAARSGAVFAPAQSERLRQAVDLAGLLLDKPAGRIRNQALALISELDTLARALAAPRGAPLEPALK